MDHPVLVNVYTNEFPRLALPCGGRSVYPLMTLSGFEKLVVRVPRCGGLQSRGNMLKCTWPHYPVSKAFLGSPDSDSVYHCEDLILVYIWRPIILNLKLVITIAVQLPAVNTPPLRLTGLPSDLIRLHVSNNWLNRSQIASEARRTLRGLIEG